jgi:FkbH-like protein
MKLIDALKINAGNPPEGEAETLSVALVCGFTPLHLQTFLTAELRTAFAEQHIEIVTGQYDNVAGTLADLRDRSLEAVVLILEWPDLDPRLGTRQLGGWSPRNLPDVVDRVRLRLAELTALLEKLSSPVVVSLPALPLPPLFFSAGWQASACELQLRAAVLDFAAQLARNSRVRVLSDKMGSERLDVRSNWSTGFPYRMAHASALAGLLAKAVQNTQPKKGIITDLDHTLWNGIVGEDGPRNVSWDLDHNTQGHGVYQQFLSTLAQEGVLVGVASKNDPAFVAEAFSRADILLPPDLVFPFEVSWGSKAEAVSRVLNAWNVQADSVVFVDDDPLELANVKAAHPAIECVPFPSNDPEAIYQLIVSLRDSFGRSTISHEDEIRRQSLRARSIAVAGDNASDGFSEMLLEDAGGELTFEFRKTAGDSRALELINKTNQFNLNGKRFTEGKWADYLKEDDTFVLTSAYKDKFGALGKIAVLAGRIRPQREVVVDAWVLSCRAFGRRIEHHCLQVLFEKLGADRVRFAYEATDRNKPITRCLSELLGGDPGSDAVLRAPEFHGRCPRLFHHVSVENDYA